MFVKMTTSAARKRISVLLAAAMLLSVLLLAGCEQQPSGVSETPSSSVPEEVPNESSAPAESSRETSGETGPESGDEDLPPVFPDAENGSLPPLTHAAGETPDLTDVRVEDDKTPEDGISISITDDGGYDPSVPGEYTIVLTASDGAGNAVSASRKVTVTAKEETSEQSKDEPQESSSSPQDQPAESPAVSEDPKEPGGGGREEADVMIYASQTPYVLNEENALKYTASGTAFRSRDVIQIMETEVFLKQYSDFSAGHTNNGGVPYFPNGVLLLVDKDFRIREARVAAGELFELDEKGNLKTGALTWTNAIDASGGGGLFKGIVGEIGSVLPKGGYLIFCGNIGEQKCRRFLIRQLLVSDYESGALQQGQIDVPAKARTVGWTTKESGSKDEPDDTPGGTGKVKTVVSASEAIAGFPVYSGTVQGEAKKPSDPAVFQGAWYRKAVSSKDAWAGIEATVTLPSFSIKRYSGTYDETLDADPNVKNLDNPSVYLGGKCKYESDIGLSLSLGLVKTASGGTAISKGSVCFRPFWRYITNDNQDAGGYNVHDGKYAVTANGSNCIGNWHYSYTEYYYLPGDTLRLMVFSPEENKLQFAIQVISVSTLESSVEMREKNGWKQPADFLSPVFSSPGYGTGEKTEYKRVTAIDQNSNEGKPAIATESESRDTQWLEVYLYRLIDGEMRRVPMTKERFGERNAPDDAHVTVKTTAPETGGETVTIHPGYTN